MKRPGNTVATMVVGLALLGAAAWVGVPRLDGETRGHGSAALSTMRSIVRAQLAYRAEVRLDTDGDGLGEAGFFPELAGHPPFRPRPDELRPSLLPCGMQAGHPESIARSDYRFQLLLPSTAGGWTASPEHPVDADRAEREFAVVVWPDSRLDHEDRLFAATADGRVFVAHDPDRRWVGTKRPPLPPELDPGARSAETPAWSLLPGIDLQSRAPETTARTAGGR